MTIGLANILSRASFRDLRTFGVLGALGITSSLLTLARAPDCQWIARRFLLDGNVAREAAGNADAPLHKFLLKTRNMQVVEYSKKYPTFVLACGHAVDVLQKTIAIAGWYFSHKIVPSPKFLHIIPGSSHITALFAKTAATSFGAQVAQIAGVALRFRHVISLLPIILKAVNIGLEIANVQTEGDYPILEKMRYLTERWGNRAEALFLVYSGVMAFSGLSAAMVISALTIFGIGKMLMTKGVPNLAAIKHVNKWVGLLAVPLLGVIYRHIRIVSPGRLLAMSNFVAAYKASHKDACSISLPELITELDKVQNFVVQINDASKTELLQFATALRDKQKQNLLSKEDCSYFNEILSEKIVLAYTRDIPAFLGDKNPTEARAALENLKNQYLKPFKEADLIQPDHLALLHGQIETYQIIQDLLHVESLEEPLRQQERDALNQRLEKKGILKDQAAFEEKPLLTVKEWWKGENKEIFMMTQFALLHPAFQAFEKAGQFESLFEAARKFLETGDHYQTLLAYMRAKDPFRERILQQKQIADDLTKPMNEREEARLKLVALEPHFNHWVALEKKLCGINEDRMRESDPRLGLNRPLQKELYFLAKKGEVVPYLAPLPVPVAAAPPAVAAPEVRAADQPD